MSRKDHPLYLRLLRTRIGTPLQVKARLENEMIRREHVHGVNSEITEQAVAALIDYEQIKHLEIEKELKLQPRRRPKNAKR